MSGSSETKTELPRLRTFGIRAAEGFLAHLRASTDQNFSFPCAVYGIEEERSGGANTTTVTVRARSAYGSTIVLTIHARFTGMTIQANFHADVTQRSRQTRWRGFVVEDQDGFVTMSRVEQTAQVPEA